MRAECGGWINGGRETEYSMMTDEAIRSLIEQGETLSTEFKSDLVSLRVFIESAKNPTLRLDLFNGQAGLAFS